MKKIIPVSVAIILGVVVLVDFFVPSPRIDAIGAILLEGVSILAAFALLLGLLNILGVHSSRIARREQHPGMSVALIIAMIGTFAVGVGLTGSGALEWLFQYAYLPLQATMTGLLAFFIVTAIYRSFRINSLQASLLVGTTLLLLITQVPTITQAAPPLAAVRDWLLRVPVTAGTRGIILGTALGTIATSLRVLLAVDTPYVGE